MLNYILQIILFQVLFFIVYEFLLKKETFFTGNRIYLLATQVLVLVLPILRFPQIQENIPVEYQSAYTKSYHTISTIVSPVLSTKTQNSFQFKWEWVVYLGMGISFILFCSKFFTIYKFISKNTLSKFSGYIKVKLDDNSTAFSFWKYVFIGNQITLQKQQEIIQHERIHIQKKHSIDQLFFEILRIAFWYNPLIYLYQKRITEVHEFQVDYELSKVSNQKKQYFESILSDVFNTENISFISSFYKGSLIKKRIQMLSKMKSKDRQRLKYFFIAPILALTTTYVACNENSKQLAILMDDANWHSTNYKTGDAIKVFQYMPQVQKNGNFIDIYNSDPFRDAIVKFIEYNSDTIFRDVYIKAGESVKLKDFPLGKYYLKIASGNYWLETCSSDKCFGKFSRNSKFKVKHKKQPIEFSTTDSRSGKIASVPFEAKLIKI